ncbi:hypothetical protein AB0M46_13270 [Dactylosporangium sp. NPDC051485]|uniref:DUF6541 family protein n=1 Tax=Dactylosporangium sp. NPDC051485 TaxID=3154846 RepID=UPI0034291B7B
MILRRHVLVRALDPLVMLGYVLGAVYVLQHLWADPNGRYLALNFQDHFTFEWFLTHATELFTHGRSPFFSDDVNYPMGVNLMANTSILTVALPLTPVTLWLGVGVTFAIISTLAIAGTAAGWYWVLSREFGRSRIAAGVAGAFLGFAPAIVSQAAGHPNIAGQALIPLIVAAVLRLRHPGRVWRRGLWLAALVVLQAGINEEMLFFTALGLAVFLLAYIPPRQLPSLARAAWPKLGVAVLAALAVLAYPLYFQFWGPQTYRGLDNGVRAINLDILSYFNFGRYSLAGDVAEAARLNRDGASEENSFFGLPLIILLLAGSVALWRSRLSRALFVTGFVFMICSFGDVLRYNGIDYHDAHGPWHWIATLPLFDSIVPTRLGLIVTVAVGVEVALLIDVLVVERLRLAFVIEEFEELEDFSDIAELDDVSDHDHVPALVGSGPAAASVFHTPAAPSPISPAPPPTLPSGPPISALVWALALVIALVPLIPLPQPAADRPALPAIFADGNWRKDLPPDPVVVTLPSGWNENFNIMRWSTDTRFEVKFVAGYFLGPNDTDPTDKNAHFGPGWRNTTSYFLWVRTLLTSPDVTPAQREDMREDLKFWKATTIVFPVGWRDERVIRQTIDKLVAPEVAPGRIVDGVWLWDVRPITAG